MSRIAIAFASLLLLSGFARKPEPLTVMVLNGSRLEPLFTVKNDRLEIVGHTDCEGGRKNMDLWLRLLEPGRTHWIYSGGRRLGPLWISDYPGGRTEIYVEGLERYPKPLLVSNRPDLGQDRDGRMQVSADEMNRARRIAEKLLIERGYHLAMNGSRPGYDLLVQKTLISSKWPIVFAAISGVDFESHRPAALWFIAEASPDVLTPQYIEISKNASVPLDYPNPIDQLDIDKDGTDELILWNTKVMKKSGDRWIQIFERPDYACS